MKIGVLGSGTVGRTLAGKLSSLGHDVTIGTRDVDSLMARTDPDQMGNPPFAEWKESFPDIAVDTFEVAAQGELLVNATSGGATLEALKLAGAANLSGKVLIDVANPLDFSRGFPPSLSVCNTDSLAEQIQREFPEAKVVKSLNTMTAAMVDPGAVAGGDHDVFVSGNDQSAKDQVRALLESFGWINVLHLGGLETARGVEMWLPLWLSLMGPMGGAMFNLKLVKA
ncbi:MAG: 8-hydroxy-5-deazaflavin:NADPH oxidoreductase [Actinomycetota bacterium]|nr:8-hydroxy-5-deazaflavin:NADPH oxidoreductase [Actinomycetota bacterium]